MAAPNGRKSTVTKETFKSLTDHKIVLLDGATGSCLRELGMPPGVCTEAWILEHPDVFLRLQREYVDAGSLILMAPTFSANRISLAMHGLENDLIDINARLIQLSKQAAQDRAYVAGEVTTTGRRDLSYDELIDIYKEQISVLANAGSDLIATETMLAPDETMAALEAAQSVCDLPVMCMLTAESDGALLWGGNIVEAAESLEALGASAVGINCSVGPNQLEAVVSAVRQAVNIPVIVKPNAGMPVMDEFGVAHYDMSVDAFAKAMRKLVWRGAGIIGGCCGTSPEYIRALSRQNGI